MPIDRNKEWDKPVKHSEVPYLGKVSHDILPVIRPVKPINSSFCPENLTLNPALKIFRLRNPRIRFFKILTGLIISLFEDYRFFRSDSKSEYIFLYCQKTLLEFWKSTRVLAGFVSFNCSAHKILYFCAGDKNGRNGQKIFNLPWTLRCRQKSMSGKIHVGKKSCRQNHVGKNWCRENSCMRISWRQNRWRPNSFSLFAAHFKSYSGPYWVRSILQFFVSLF